MIPRAKQAPIGARIVRLRLGRGQGGEHKCEQEHDTHQDEPPCAGTRRSAQPHQAPRRVLSAVLRLLGSLN
jgi:hypothetical protein